MPRFVLLHHTSAPDYKPDHWDLMLEHEGRLLTWELTKTGQNSFFAKDSRPLFVDLFVDAVQLPDHRLHYLDYEGPLSGNRGIVQRVDSGQYELRSATDDRYEFVLAGTTLRGEALLQRTETGWSLRILNA